MSKILTRFYLEDGAWAKLQYVAALMHKAPKDVAELIMARALDDEHPVSISQGLVSFDASRQPKPKKGRKK